MIEISDRDEKTLLEWKQSIKAQVDLTLILTGKDGDAALDEFCVHLESYLPLVKVLRKTDPEAILPRIKVSETISYSAVPLDRELSPFLEALALRVQDPTGSVETSVPDLDVPARFKLFIANACPHCPGVVRTLLGLAMSSSTVHLSVIDGTLFPEAAAKDSVLSAPTLILDDDFRWIGNVTLDEIIKVAVNRDPSQLSSASLKMILEEGRADWIARKMIESRSLFLGFVSLMTHPLWSVRLGAMVVLETLVEEAPDLAAAIVPLLQERYFEVDLPAKGDILYALGEAGDMVTLSWINSLVEGMEDEELLEAAKDATSSINDRLES